MASNAVGFIAAAFIFAWAAGFMISAATFGVKSLFWTAYGRRNKSV